MHKLKRGYLICQDKQWFFRPGNVNTTSNRNKLVPLHDFVSEASQLIESQQLQQHWLTLAQTHEAQSWYIAQSQMAWRVMLSHTIEPAALTDLAIQLHLHNEHEAFTCKVSAMNLIHRTPPKNLKQHHILDPSDKFTWDQAYDEEYFGLYEETKTWEYLTEKEYQDL
eukprot:12482435-Ditylum_brightwellii.AAC.1